MRSFELKQKQAALEADLDTVCKDISGEGFKTADIVSVAELLQESDADKFAEFSQKATELDQVNRDLAKAAEQLEKFKQLAANRPAPAVHTKQHQYSLGSVYKACAAETKVEGVEAEVHEELARRKAMHGREVKGIQVPLHAFFQKSNATIPGGNVEELVSEDYRSELFSLTEAALKEQLLMGRLGARMITSSEPTVRIPLQDGAVAGGWIARDGDTALSDISTKDVSLTPHSYGARSEVNRSALLYGNPDVQSLVTADIVRDVRSAIDLAALKGTGAANQPTGVFLDPGIQVYQIGGAGTTATLEYSDVLAMVRLVEDKLYDVPLSVLTTRTLRDVMKTTMRYSGTGVVGDQVMWLDNNTVDGKPAYASSYMDDSLDTNAASEISVLAGSEIVHCIWDTVSVLPNPYAESSYIKGAMQLISIVDSDVVARRPETIVLCSNAANNPA